MSTTTLDPSLNAAIDKAVSNLGVASEQPGYPEPAAPLYLSEAEVLLAADTRVFADEQGNQRPFKVLVVDSPEKWLPAETVCAFYDMPKLGTSQTTRFRFSGLSLAAWDDLEAQHLMPAWQGDGEPNAAFLAEREKISREKMAHVLELSLGHKIPGATWAAKAVWIERMNPGEMQAMYLSAQYDACALRNGSLLDEYNLMATRAQAQVQEFAGFEGMQEASKSQYFFRRHRPGDEYILEFPLKGISAKQREEIENECKEPEPPKAPQRDPITRKVDFKNLVPNTQDKQWLDSCRTINRRRTMMFFNACLPFEIPGKTLNAQFDWLGGRLVGDVVKLKDFITDELTSYSSRYRFL